LYDARFYEPVTTYADIKDSCAFTIVDYRDENVVIGEDAHEVLTWYKRFSGDCYYPEQAEMPDCEGCETLEWGEGCKQREQIAERRKLYGDPNMPVKEIMRREMLILGAIVIHGWEGDIHPNIVRQLGKLCTYYCNHMG
jgi:hypothetical protein